MSTQQSNERRANRPRPLSQMSYNARQLLQLNTQRAANWFRKPSFPRFRLRLSSLRSSLRSRSSPIPGPYSHSGSTDDTSASIKTSSSATLLSIESIRPRAQRMSAYTRMVRTSPVIVPIMPTVSRLFFFLVPCSRGWPDHHALWLCINGFSFLSSGSSPFIK